MSDRTDMDHDATIEAIELAALEPGGLDRLMAGDTIASQAVAAHLAGCGACTAELVALSRDARVIADVVATTPAADLRDRTLATVRAQGVVRGAVQDPMAVAPGLAAAPGPAAAQGVAAPVPATAPVPVAAADGRPAPVAGTSRQPRRMALGWVAAIAAAVVLSVGATSLVVGIRSRDQLAAQSGVIDALKDVALGVVSVASQPDATKVELTGATDPSLSGSVLLSPSSTELVVVVTGLTQPPAGQEFSCWIDAGAGRVRVGRMYFGGGLAYWVGTSAAIAGLDGPATFGVSLVPAGASVTDAAPVLVGRT